MKNHLIYLSVLLGLFMLPLHAQNCSDFIAWAKRLEVEFPNLRMGQLLNGGSASNRILFNLYGDESFVELAGRPFDEFRPSSLQGKGAKMLKCARKSSNLDQGIKQWFQYFGLAPMLREQDAALVRRAVAELL